MERETGLQYSSCHRRDWTCCTVHAHTMRHHPVDIHSLLPSCLVFCRGMGASALSRTTSTPCCREGFQLMRMHLGGRQRLCGVRMLWGRGWLLGSFATALRPVRSLMLAPHFPAVAQGLLRPSARASPEHGATDRTQETPRAPCAIREERPSACVLHDLAQALPGLLTALACLAPTWPRPQQAACPVQQHHGPAV